MKRVCESVSVCVCENMQPNTIEVSPSQRLVEPANKDVSSGVHTARRRCPRQVDRRGSEGLGFHVVRDPQEECTPHAGNLVVALRDPTSLVYVYVYVYVSVYVHVYVCVCVCDPTSLHTALRFLFLLNVLEEEDPIMYRYKYRYKYTYAYTCTYTYTSHTNTPRMVMMLWVPLPWLPSGMK